MRISYNWLKYHFGELPSPKDLEERITFGVFEVESVEEIGDDTIIDLKVLPDRAHYALSFNGIGYEVGALIRKPFAPIKFEKISGVDNKVAVEVKDSKLCPRYMARFVGDVRVGDSPVWLKNELEKIGQRSINSLVDMANYVMFATGQPMHVFDADKVKGHSIIVRPAKNGEKIDCLDGNSYELSSDNLLIADGDGPLVIAGVKGGRRAEVTMHTKNIIIESANFDPVSVRKTSTKFKLKSDAAKRYENEPTPDACSYAMDLISHLIQAENQMSLFGEITDVYPNPAKLWNVEFRKEYVESRLGRKIYDDDIKQTMNLIQCEIIDSKGDTYKVQPPLFRLDLKIEEDFVEEIGRLLGYDKIKEVLPPKISKEPTVDNEFYVSEKIKDILIAKGFSETILYTLGEKGELETLYPVADDKGSLRKSLLPHIEESLATNSKNAELLGLEIVKIFEVGKVFGKDSEKLMLGIGVSFAKKIKGKKPADVLSDAMQKLKEMGFDLKAKIIEKNGEAYFEAPLDSFVSDTKSDKPYEEINFNVLSRGMFKPFSKYPFAVRDVAVFVPNDVKVAEVEKLINDKAGESAISIKLFDTFKKDEKTSYAFRIIFQSMDKTLTEEEINAPLNSVYEAMKAKGWEVR